MCSILIGSVSVCMLDFRCWYYSKPRKISIFVNVRMGVLWFLMNLSENRSVLDLLPFGEWQPSIVVVYGILLTHFDCTISLIIDPFKLEIELWELEAIYTIVHAPYNSYTTWKAFYVFILCSLEGYNQNQNLGYNCICALYR